MVFANKIATGSRPTDIEGIRLADATLPQYAMALRSAEGESFREMAIRKFFEDKAYKESSHNGLTTYTHFKHQWVHSKFWTEVMGFEMVWETNYGYMDEIPAQMTSMEYEPKKTMQVYKNATVFFEKKNKDSTERIVIHIQKNDHDGTFDYDIYHQDKHYFDEWTTLADQKNFYRGKKINASCGFLDLKQSSWEDVILSIDKKEIIKNSASGLFAHRALYKEFGVPVKRGVILHGPPGTGKTQVCKALANDASDHSVLYVMPSDFEPSRGGVRRIATMAQDLAPCLLIIEDIDFIAKDRSLGTAGAVIELMNYLDGLEEFGDIVTFGTTNHLDVIEDAIKNRPGRFDRLIEIGNPGLEEREAMILRFTSRFKMEGKDISKIAKSLALKMDRLSGAHIKDICNTAAAIAVRDGSITEADGARSLVIKSKHFREALKEVSNKDFTSYYELQSKSKGLGFRSEAARAFDILDDEGDW